MRYVLLIYANPASREVWDSLTDEQRAAGYRAYAALDDELRATGELVISEALADLAQTTRVTVRDGRTLTTDGPFAEAKEQLAGVYVVDCDSAARAAEIAARIPGAGDLVIEVRPAVAAAAGGAP